jgi:AcrR family transcriptional regulator
MCNFYFMNKPQSRSLQTRARLLEAAKDIIAETGYEGLRTQEVVKRAGVAKGTFFAHFHDKDALMEILVAAKMDAFLDRAETAPAPDSVETMVAMIMPLIDFMRCERYVFDVILRHSGAAAKDNIGPIALTFARQDEVFTKLLENAPFRKDISAGLLGEGIQAFAIQALALDFCTINNEMPLEERLTIYLNAWLLPGG